MIEVELPDGNIAEFPDGTDKTVIQTALRKRFGGQQPTQAPAPAAAMRPEPDMLQRAIDATRGLRDIPQAGSQLINEALPDSFVAKGNELIGKANQLPVIGPLTQALGIVPDAPDGYSKEIQREEEAYQARRAAAGETGVDLSRLAGNIAGTAPLQAVLPGAGIGASLAARTGTAIGQGAVLGAAQPVVDGGENFAEDKLTQASIGAATAGILTPAIGAAARVIRPNTAPEIQRLIDEGITPTPGQILGGGFARAEEKLTSVPLLGDVIKNAQRRTINDFNKAAYQRALDPIGGKAPDAVGREGVQAVKEALGNAYDNLLPNLKFIPDQQFAQELTKIRSMASQLPEPQAKRFENIINNEFISRSSPNGGMAGETFKQAESELSRLARRYGGDPSVDNQELGRALGEVLESARSTLSRVNPQHADDLAAINLGYANYARIRDAAGRLGAEEGVFTPAQLQSAVRSGDKSAGKGRFATGDALLQDLSEAAKNTISSKYPDSGTAGRALQAFALGGGGVAIDPVAGGAALTAMLPYTQAGQRISANLLTSRPDLADPLANYLRLSAPSIAAGGAIAAPGFVQASE